MSLPRAAKPLFLPVSLSGALWLRAPTTQRLRQHQRLCSGQPHPSSHSPHANWSQFTRARVCHFLLTRGLVTCRGWPAGTSCLHRFAVPWKRATAVDEVLSLPSCPPPCVPFLALLLLSLLLQTTFQSSLAPKNSRNLSTRRLPARRPRYVAALLPPPTRGISAPEGAPEPL